MNITFKPILSISLVASAIYAAYALLNPSLSIAVSSNEADEQQQLATATFAGGCFWCMERPFEALPGVKDVVSGYTGGKEKNPTYKQVSAGITGHIEAVKISFDPAQISYQKLLDVYWRQFDPTDDGGSFVDRGSHYRSAIFYHDGQQLELAQQSKSALDHSGIYDKPVVTEIRQAGEFYNAEDYHQDYYKTNPVRYKFYRYRSGRDQFLEKTWANVDENMTFAKMDKQQSGKEMRYTKPSDRELRERLTPLQYKITQQDGTERPFDNEYWDNKKAGIYVDVVSGEPLFSSTDKYDSKTGWPSFTKPIEDITLVEKEDRSLFSVRTELRSKQADSHLGHVFNDGPAPTGKRYCINSAALRFIPKERLVAENYSQYTKLFD